MAKVHVMDHPLITHKISYIRSEEVGTKEFREMIGEIAQLMCYEATSCLLYTSPSPRDGLLSRMPSSA